MRLRLLAILAVIVLFVAAAFRAEPPDWTDLSAVLLWLAGPGAGVAVLALGAWLNQAWPWWRDAAQNVKDLVTMVAAALVALAASYIPLAVVEQLAPVYRIVATVILSLVMAGFGLWQRKRGMMAEYTRRIDKHTRSGRDAPK